MIMTFWMQWFQQHNVLLLLCLIVILAGIFVLIFRRQSLAWWGAWCGLVVTVVVTLFLLRTAPISINAYLGQDETYVEPNLNSVAAIKSLIANGDKPTLVEFYVDYGFN